MDRLRITCLVDNGVMHGSRLWGEHGLSFLIEMGSAKVLWDTGQTKDVLWHNLHALGLEQLEPTAVGLSHAHYDHTGGLASLLERYPDLSVYAHQSLFRPRYSSRQGKPVQIGLSNREQILRQRADLHLSAEPQRLAESIWTTGTITPRPYPQGASARHAMRVGGQMLPDDYADDMSLVIRLGSGIIVVCGCCHAGLRNTLGVVRERFEAPIMAILGGTHLVHADQEELKALSALLQKENGPALYLNHCTGEKALWYLQQVFGDRVTPCPAGKVVEF